MQEDRGSFRRRPSSPPSAKIASLERLRDALERGRGRHRRLLGQDGRANCTGSSPTRKVLEWNEPFAKWFVGGQTNVSYNCLDAHLSTPRQNKAALIWEGEPGDAARADLPDAAPRSLQVRQRAEEAGHRQGDVVSIYMPMVPELAIAMLACARIGAVHSVIFGGFSSEAIADRNNDAKAKLHDHGRRRLAARQATAAEGKRRRGAGKSRRPSRSASCVQPHRQRRRRCSRAATSGGTI